MRRRTDDYGRRLEEGHGRDRRERHEAVGQLDQAAVVGVVDLTQGGGAFGEEGVGLAADAARDAGAEVQVVCALVRGDVAQKLGALWK